MNCLQYFITQGIILMFDLKLNNYRAFTFNVYDVTWITHTNVRANKMCISSTYQLILITAQILSLNINGIVYTI